VGERRIAGVAERPIVAGRSMTNGRPFRRSRCERRLARIGAALASMLLGTSAPVAAQDRCYVLCQPELKVEPTFTTENLARSPLIEVLEDGIVVERARATREMFFELIFALDVPTVVPRVGLTFEAIVKPFGATDVNPFTGVRAVDIGRREIRDNGVEIESEFNLQLCNEDQTRGWISSHVDVVDQFSPAHQPTAGSAYTHKLDFEWDTAFHIFKPLPDGRWLRNTEVEVSLDYLATGLPKAGHVLGVERFVDDASPWSLSFVFVIPLAPLAP
jgi:hypothetical protein